MDPLPADRRAPHPVRLPLAHPWRARILAAHEAALARDADDYLDPLTGYRVFTAAFLWRRGSCCDSGCRHCPFLPRS